MGVVMLAMLARGGAAAAVLPAGRHSALHTLRMVGVQNNLVAYTLRVALAPAVGGSPPRPGVCGASGLVVRSFAPALAEDKFWAHECLTTTAAAWSLSLTFHGFHTPRGAAKNELLRPLATNEDLVLQLFLDPTQTYHVR